MLLVFWFLIISLVFIIGGIVLFIFNDSSEDSAQTLVIIGLVGLIISGCLGIRTKKCRITQELINNEFKTNYTVEEIFWGGETIKKMLEGTLERKEIDVILKQINL